MFIILWRLLDLFFFMNQRLLIIRTCYVKDSDVRLNNLFNFDVGPDLKSRRLKMKEGWAFDKTFTKIVNWQREEICSLSTKADDIIEYWATWGKCYSNEESRDPEVLFVGRYLQAIAALCHISPLQDLWYRSKKKSVWRT